MEPAAQWEDASNIMNTKTNCDAILRGPKGSGPQDSGGFVGETEKEPCCRNKTVIRFICGDFMTDRDLCFWTLKVRFTTGVFIYTC